MKKLLLITFSVMAVLLAGCKDVSSGIPDVVPEEPKYSPEELLADKVIDGITFSKTSEIDVMNLSARVKMKDDSFWSGYIDPDDFQFDIHIGVFIKNRAVTLSPFAMGQYEVTQELFTAVMGFNPSNFKNNPAEGETQKLRPVENVLWQESIIFCNRLSIKEGLEPCYSSTKITDWENCTKSDGEKLGEYDVTVDLSKNGYRLPTEAEWEFAARGGNPKAEYWKWSYAGVNTEKEPENFAYGGGVDQKLDGYAWCYINSEKKSHEVGLKAPNKLGLYDMSGNVCEWCADTRLKTLTTDAVTDPLINSWGPRVLRGGSYDDTEISCTVSDRTASSVADYKRESDKGFRIVRTLKN